MLRLLVAGGAVTGLSGWKRTVSWRLAASSWLRWLRWRKLPQRSDMERLIPDLQPPVVRLTQLLPQDRWPEEGRDFFVWKAPADEG